MAQQKETVTIPFKDSTITGLKLKSLNGKEFYGFVGIRYAQPPIGDLRFMPPQPIEKYPEHIDATEFGGVCVQRRNVLSVPENVGTEDCLFANIFIPQLPSENQKLKPVILKVMGGVYNRGRSHWLHPYPTTLIEKDVIYVNFVYRLHILGFLNLGIEECPGNVGLKDHAAVLQWLVSNVRYFGGDPDNITLCGTSSGANAVLYLAMSPLTKGLFKKAILSSPLAIYPWNIEHQPVERAFKFGRKLGFTGKDDKKELLAFFKKQSAEDMFNVILECRSTEMTSEVEALWAIFLFRPSIEYIKEGAFLPESPFKLWEKVDSLSLICGFCENEGITFVTQAVAPDDLKYADTVKYIMKATIRDSFDLKEEETTKMYEEVERFYFSNEENNLDVLSIAMEFFSDYQLRNFYGPKSFIRKPQVDTAYSYLFTYDGNLNVTKKIWAKRFPKVFKGTYHSDEYCYVIETPDQIVNGVPNENDLQVIQNMVSLFTNFAKTGNPNGERLECGWTPTTEENPCYLNLDKDLKLINNEMRSRGAKFWNYLLQKFCTN